MEYAESSLIMESRIGSVSSGLEYSAVMRGHLSNTPFCPPSTSKLSQAIITDHMVSHYKKIYSAKAVVDTSVPKSLIHSVKYNDQIRQDRLRKERNTRASCSSVQSRLSAQYDDGQYVCSSSMVSSPRFSTSFHAKEIVYPSCKVCPQNHCHHTRPASEIKYKSSEAALPRKQSAWSQGGSADQSWYKTFQGPVRNTYSGDLLQKHSQHFTKVKPFTPKTLKSEKTSYLSNYRYYRAPQRNRTQGCTNSRLKRQETYHGSTRTMDYSWDFDEPTRGFECSESELNGAYFISRQESQTNKRRDRNLFDSSSRLSSDGGKSPDMMSVSAEKVNRSSLKFNSGPRWPLSLLVFQLSVPFLLLITWIREEELMYLQFISTVTEDILSKGHISDRVLNRVINHHINMNRHQLDEGKMRHLLEELRNDFEKPIGMFTSSTELEKKKKVQLDTLLPRPESRGKQMKTKEDNDLLPYASLIKRGDTPDHTDLLSEFTTLCSPEKTASPAKTNEDGEEGDKQKQHIVSPRLSEHITINSGANEDNFHKNEIDSTATGNDITNESYRCTTVIGDEEFHQDQSEVRYGGQLKEIEDLGRRFSESLLLSNINSNILEPANEQQTDVAGSVSDDDF